jgi:hypothetical protein
VSHLDSSSACCMSYASVYRLFSIYRSATARATKTKKSRSSKKTPGKQTTKAATAALKKALRKKRRELLDSLTKRVAAAEKAEKKAQEKALKKAAKVQQKNARKARADKKAAASEAWTLPYEMETTRGSQCCACGEVQTYSLDIRTCEAPATRSSHPCLHAPDTKSRPRPLEL